jgi:protein phosphatase
VYLNKLYEFAFNALSEVGRVIVVGDIHGDYESFRKACSLFDEKNDYLIFLGDYADRGSRGVEVIEGVLALLEKYPSRVIALKGNHEDYTVDGQPKFMPCTLILEVNEKRGSWRTYFQSELQAFLSKLYLAAIVPNQVLFVHGGVSRNVRGITDLRFPSQHVASDLLWSDPFDGVGEHLNLRGVGVEFGKDVSKRVCRRLGVERIVRSHQPRKARDGPCVEHDGRVITIGSTRVYGGKPFVLALPARDLGAACATVEKYAVYLR